MSARPPAPPSLAGLLLGALLTLAFVRLGGLDLPAALLLLAALVVLPLGVPLLHGPEADGAPHPLHRQARRALDPAALLLGLALLLERGPLALALALPWAAVTVALSLWGLRQLAFHGLRDPATLLESGGCAFLLVGGAWTLADRAGLRPLGYDPLLVRLTAVHFHYAGFGLPLLAGLAARRSGGSRPLAIALLAGMGVVAAGLVASQLTDHRAAEWAAATFMALAASLAALGQLREAVRGGRPLSRPLSRPLLALSALCLLWGMGLAAAWGAARGLGLARPHMVDMLHAHGAVNALGFVLLGLLGRALDPPPVSRPPLGLPATGLPWARRVGWGWFERAGVADPQRPPPPGQLDRLSDLDQPGFSAAEVCPPVREFYERTSEWALSVRPRWRRGLGLAGRAYARGMGSIGNLSLPTDQGGAWQPVTLRIAAARPGSTGALLDARIYERGHADGRPMFIALYATTAAGGRPLMVVVLPLPGAAMVALLRPEGAPGGAMTLRSHPEDALAEGIFLDTPLGPFRLPVSERLEIGPGPRSASGTTGGAELVATHTLSLFGIACVELDYQLRRASNSAAS